MSEAWLLSLQRCGSINSFKIDGKVYKTKYKIHGLWKQNWIKTARNCKPCGKMTPNGSCEEKNHNIMKIYKKINSYWKSCKNKNDIGFWKHEYEKHGACTGLTSDQYFVNTINLFEEAVKRGDGYIDKFYKSNKKEARVYVYYNKKREFELHRGYKNR